MINQITKGKSRQEKPKLKVMHAIDKNNDGTFSIASNAPKLKETVDPAPKAEFTAKPVKTKTVSKPPAKNGELNEFDVKVLRALSKLGGSSTSMPLAKETGTVRTHEDAPRAPIRASMERLAKQHFVTSKKEGQSYTFTITDKGKASLKDKHDPDDVPDHMLNEAHKAKQAKEAGSPPASSGSILCPKCNTINPFDAEYCKECGTILRQRAETVLKAAQPPVAA